MELGTVSKKNKLSLIQVATKPIALSMFYPVLLSFYLFCVVNK